MALFVTPRQLSDFSALYFQLGSTLAGGIGLHQSLEIASKSPPRRSFRRPLQLVAAALQQGFTFSEALTQQGHWMPGFDIALIRAGEQSGRLDECLRALGDYYNERAQLVRQVLAELAYPALVLFLFLLIFPPGQISSLVQNGDVWAFVGPKLGALAVMGGLVAALMYLGQARHGEILRSLIERLLRWVPLLGQGRRCLALARLSMALEALNKTGMSIIEAWDLAADVSGSPALRRAVIRAKPRILSGEVPGEVLAQSREFPEVFVSLYQTGELSGKLDDTLGRLRQYYQAEAVRKLRAFAIWFPRLIYLGLLIMVAYAIVSFWLNYYGKLLGPDS